MSIGTTLLVMAAVVVGGVARRARRRASCCLARLLGDESGATVIEYGIVVALIFLAVMVGIYLAAGRTTAMWSSIANHMGGGT